MAQFSAPLHLWRPLFSVAVVSARVVERSDSITSSHPMIPVNCLLLRSSLAIQPMQCIVRIISQLQSLQLAMLPARSELSAIRQSSLLNCALCPQSSCLSNTEFLKLSHSSSWHDFLASAGGFSTNLIRPRTHTVTSVLDLRGRSHSADSSSHLLEHLILFLAAERHWAALSDELPAHSLDVSFVLFACSWRCSYLLRILGSRSLAVFHQAVVNFSLRVTLPIHEWIQLNFDRL